MKKIILNNNKLNSIVDNKINMSINLMEAYEGFMNIENPMDGNPYIGITGYGDSVASVNGYIIGNVVKSLQLKYGIGGVCTPNLGKSWNNAAWAYTGGAAWASTNAAVGSTADFTYYPGSNQINMPTDSTASITSSWLNSTTSNQKLKGSYNNEINISELEFTKVTFIYLTKPNAGTLTFSTSQDGYVYDDIVVDTDAALGTSSVELPLVLGTDVTITITATIADCIFTGAVFWGHSGVVAFSSQVGGSDMSNQNLYIRNGSDSTVYRDLLNIMQTKLIVHHQRINDYTNLKYKDEYDEVFTSLQQHSGMCQLVLGEGGRQDEMNKYIPIVNNFLKEKTVSKQIAFIDLYKLMGSSIAILNKPDWGDNGNVHYGEKAHRYLAGEILGILNYFVTGSSRELLHTMSPSDYVNRSLVLNGLLSLKHSILTYNGSFVPDRVSASGDYTTSSSNDYGVKLSVRDGIQGNISCTLGKFAQEAYLHTELNDYSISILGYRGVHLSSGMRAYVAFGVNNNYATVTDITDKSFGVEYGWGSDVGFGDNIVVRIFAYDGTNTLYSNWNYTANDGVGLDKNYTLAYMLHWKNSTGIITLFESPDNSGGDRKLELYVPAFKTNRQDGNLVGIGLSSDDSTASPTNEYIQLQKIELRNVSNKQNAVRYGRGGSLISNADIKNSDLLLT